MEGFEGVSHIQLHWGDILTVTLYALLSVGIGLWSICKKGRTADVKNYFMAGGNIPWFPVGMSLYGSNIGSEHFVGLAGQGAASGLAGIMFEWNAAPHLLLLGWIFLPVYFSSGIYTMPEYLSKRFGGTRLQIYLTIVCLATYLFGNLSVDLYSGAIFIQQALGYHIMIGAVVLLLVALLYTVFGGLATVIFTDALGVCIMIIGSVVLTVIGFIRIGGINNLKALYMKAVPTMVVTNSTGNYTIPTNNTCGYPRQDAWHIFRDPVTGDYPWPGAMLRSMFGGMYYWTANQMIVQRALAAKNLSHGKGGCVWAAYLKYTAMFLMMMPGMISRVLFPNEVACADPDTCERICNNRVGCSNIAYPKIVVELLPVGLRGLILAVMMAAVVSSLTSILNSSSTIFTLDLWRRFRPASERELLIVGRTFVVVLGTVSVLWIPMMQAQHGGQILRYATIVLGYTGTPGCAIFLLGMFCSRINEKGAFWGLILSQLLGLVRFVLDMIYPEPPCGVLDNRPVILSKVNNYYVNAIQFFAALIIAGTVSFFTKPTSGKTLAGVTYWTRFEPREETDGDEMRPFKQNDIGYSNNNQDGTIRLEGDPDHVEVATKPDCNPCNKVYRRPTRSPPVIQTESFKDRMLKLQQSRFSKILLNTHLVLVLILYIILFAIYG